MSQRVLSAVLSSDSFSRSEGTRTKCFEDCFWRESILRSFWLGNSALDGKQSYCEEKRRRQLEDCNDREDRKGDWKRLDIITRQYSPSSKPCSEKTASN